MILQVIIAMAAGWINRHQQHVITYLKEENRVLKSKLPGGRLRLADTERRRLAKLARPLSPKQLKDTATIATPDTLMRWYNRLIAGKFDGSKNRNGPGRPRVDAEIEQLVVRMAEDNPTWGYRRIQGALANLGHTIDKITVRNILRGCNRSLPTSLCRQLPILQSLSRFQVDARHRLGHQVPLMDRFPGSTQLDYPKVQNHLASLNRPGHPRAFEPLRKDDGSVPDVDVGNSTPLISNPL
jgi:hypothetical protein